MHNIPSDQLNFLRGVAILLVIAVHLPLQSTPLWPFLLTFNFGVFIFLIVQSYIVFVKLERGERSWYSYYSIAKLWHLILRIVFPLMALSIIQYHLGMRYKTLSDFFLNAGVHGPGTYYFYVYLLFYFLLPLFWRIFSRMNAVLIFVIGLLCSSILEEVSSNLIEYLPNACKYYRVIGTRYFAIMPLALVMVRLTNRSSTTCIWMRRALGFFGGVSFLATVNYFIGTKCHWIPVCKDWGWTTHHWYYYFFPILLSKCCIEMRWKCGLQWIGRHTWVIFLVQMFWFSKFPIARLNILASGWGIVFYALLSFVFILVVTWSISVCFYYMLEKRSSITNNIPDVVDNT